MGIPLGLLTSSCRGYHCYYAFITLLGLSRRVLGPRHVVVAHNNALPACTNMSPFIKDVLLAFLAITTIVTFFAKDFDPATSAFSFGTIYPSALAYTQILPLPRARGRGSPGALA